MKKLSEQELREIVAELYQRDYKTPPPAMSVDFFDDFVIVDVIDGWDTKAEYHLKPSGDMMFALIRKKRGGFRIDHPAPLASTPRCI